MTVSFFGHKNTPQAILPILTEVLHELIEKFDANNFYVGNQGSFDYMVRKKLRELTLEYPHIKYAVVLAYMPTERNRQDTLDYSETIYPDGLENVPPQYAISKRNRWMIEKADTVVTYVTHTTGGAAQFKNLAEKKNKWVINIAELSNAP